MAATDRPLARGLTEKQRRFVEAYMGQAAGNATEAARLAGYKGNDATLAAIGCENLKKPQIDLAVSERAKSDPRVMTREQAMARLSLIGSGAGVVPVFIDDIPVKVPDTDDDLMKPARVPDQLKAIDTLAKICGWTRDDTDDNGKLTAFLAALQGAQRA